MKPYFILAFILLNLFPINNIKAIVFIDSIKISPANPVKKNTVRVLLYTSTTSVSTRIYLSSQLINNDFFIETCYDISGGSANTFYSDTLTMGELLDGTYHIIVTCHRSLGAQCDYLDTAKDTLTFTIHPPVSVDYIDASSVNIYPNPANNMLYINSTNNIHINESLIYNTHGALLSNNKGQAPINISAYPPGIYFIQLNTDKARYTQRFIKQ